MSHAIPQAEEHGSYFGCIRGPAASRDDTEYKAAVIKYTLLCFTWDTEQSESVLSV